MLRLLKGEQRSSLHSTFPESAADEYERWAELVLGGLGMVATLERERGRLGEERREGEMRKGQRREKRKEGAKGKDQGSSSIEIKWFHALYHQQIFAGILITLSRIRILHGNGDINVISCNNIDLRAKIYRCFDIPRSIEHFRIRSATS